MIRNDRDWFLVNAMHYAATVWDDAAADTTQSDAIRAIYRQQASRAREIGAQAKAGRVTLVDVDPA